MKITRYSKEKLVFGRKEDKNRYLIYSVKTRGIHIVSQKIYKIWKECNFSSILQICHRTKFPKKEVEKVLSLLIKRNLIKTE